MTFKGDKGDNHSVEDEAFVVEEFCASVGGEGSEEEGGGLVPSSCRKVVQAWRERKGEKERGGERVGERGGINK